MSIILADIIKSEDIDLPLIFSHAVQIEQFERCQKEGHVWADHEIIIYFDDFVFYPTEQSAECMRCGMRSHLD